MSSQPRLQFTYLFPLFWSLLCLACGGGSAPSASQSTLTPLFTQTFVSPDTNAHQGYTTDGTSHFIIHDNKLYRRANDAAWTVEATNDNVFSGLTGFNHLGAGEYYRGKLYVAGEQLTDCYHVSNQSILTFSPATLARESVHDVSTHIYEASALTFVTDANELWVVSYCDGTAIAVFDASTLAFKRQLPLSPALPQIQGIAYHDNRIYLAHDNGTLYELSREGTYRRIFSTGLRAEHEGIDFTTGELRWLIDGGPNERKVHFFTLTH